MQNPRPSLFNRDDTFLGVCEGLGQDLGFNPVFLRLALGLGVFWNPLAVIAGYLAMGVVVAFTRWIYPVPQGGAVLVPAERRDPALSTGDNDEAPAPAALAA